MEASLSLQPLACMNLTMAAALSSNFLSDIYEVCKLSNIPKCWLYVSLFFSGVGEAIFVELINVLAIFFMFYVCSYYPTKKPLYSCGTSFINAPQFTCTPRRTG